MYTMPDDGEVRREPVRKNELLLQAEMLLSRLH